MNAEETKLQAVENDLKQLMVDVTRAMEKAQEAVARIASKPAPPTGRNRIDDLIALEQPSCFTIVWKVSPTSVGRSAALLDLETGDSQIAWV